MRAILSIVQMSELKGHCMEAMMTSPLDCVHNNRHTIDEYYWWPDDV